MGQIPRSTERILIIEAIRAKNQFRTNVSREPFLTANWTMNERNNYDFVFVYSPWRLVRMVAVVILQS